MHFNIVFQVKYSDLIEDYIGRQASQNYFETENIDMDMQGSYLHYT